MQSRKSQDKKIRQANPRVSSRLEKNLLAYAVAASAAGVGMLAIA